MNVFVFCMHAGQCCGHQHHQAEAWSKGQGQATGFTHISCQAKAEAQPAEGSTAPARRTRGKTRSA